jgi:disulfide bond formation protein DsbB
MIKSLLFGALVAAVIGILVFVLAPRTHVVTAYLVPGIAIGGALSFITPTKVVYWLDPDGGPPAFLIIAIGCAFGFWTLVFGMIHRRLKHRGAE